MDGGDIQANDTAAALADAAWRSATRLGETWVNDTRREYDGPSLSDDRLELVEAWREFALDHGVDTACNGRVFERFVAGWVHFLPEWWADRYTEHDYSEAPRG